MDASLLARAAAMGRKDEEDASSALANRWKTLSVLELMSRTCACGLCGALASARKRERERERETNAFSVCL